MDESLEGSFGASYHPVDSSLDYMKPLIDTFRKYVADHPEEQDFAASTILLKAQAIVARAQGATGK